MTTLPPSPNVSSSLKNSKPRAGRGLAEEAGAGNEARTRDLNLGKVALYQLSYSRLEQTRNCRAVPYGVKDGGLQEGGPSLQLRAAPQFGPGQAQVQKHRPQREQRGDAGQDQAELVDRDPEKVVPVQQQ